MAAECPGRFCNAAGRYILIVERPNGQVGADDCYCEDCDTIKAGAPHTARRRACCGTCDRMVWSRRAPIRGDGGSRGNQR